MGWDEMGGASAAHCFCRLRVFSSANWPAIFSSFAGQFSATCPSLPQKRHFLCGPAQMIGIMIARVMSAQGRGRRQR
jgi:hypothetical protein